MDSNKPGKTKTKKGVILLWLLILLIISISFLFGKPPYAISFETTILIAFLVLLVLSEDFDSFSINKIITLSRSVKEKETTNKRLLKENFELRNQLINLSNNTNQNHSNTNVTVNSPGYFDTTKVMPANEPEKEEKRNEIEDPTDGRNTSRRAVSFSKIEEFLLPKFIDMEGLDYSTLVRSAKLVGSIEQVDPINEYSPVFDGYIRNENTEMFFEMKSIGAGPLLREKLYFMLSKINYYRTTQQVNAILYLVLVIRPHDDAQIQERQRQHVEKILKEFEPARNIGILEVRHIEISETELEAIKTQEHSL
ncbi:MAG: hypothetical protein ACK5CL_08395 [Sphingomonadales bacterium]|jgi:hypothetical protein